MRRSSNNRLRVLLLAGCAGLALAPAMASAQAQSRTAFNIPAQDLGTALTQFGQQSEREIVFSADLTRNLRARAVSGELTTTEALSVLLADSGLNYRTTSGGSIIVEAAADPQSGSAAGDGAEVEALIVTAQKREEDIQDVPIAISAFTQEDLTRSQVAGGPDLMTQVPNFTFTKTNFSSYSIQIRGIGTQAVSATVDPAVAVAFNNTPFIRNRFFEQEFYDLERIEVLRGPQGTLYGRNATAGVVNIISAKPKNHFEAKLSADVANYHSTRLEGMLNLPLVEDKAALRIAGAWTKRDGFVKNTITGDQIDGRDLWSARVTLGLTPTDWLTANLIYEHFEEKDDRLRSGKQLCHRDPGPSEINGVPIIQNADPVFSGPAAAVYWTQGCKPASLYSPDSFQTPNGFGLPYAAAAGLAGAPVYYDADPYMSHTQSRNLREIETRLAPEYEASTDTVELQLQFDLPGELTLASETAFSHDRIFSFEDFNRFNTKPGIFIADGSYTSVSPDGFVCDAQLGCSDRLTAGDLSTAMSRHFSQEFRVASDYDGPFNFSLGANFLRYDTEDKYYVFINTLSVIAAGWADDIDRCLSQAGTGPQTDWNGFAWSFSGKTYGLGACTYNDFNDIHHLNDLGRNYFLSKNPYHLLSYAVFGEAYYQIAPNLKLTAGLRWTDDRKTAPQIPSWLLAGGSYGNPALKVIDQEWKEPTGRLAIDWKPELSFTDETLLYASYVHGYKAGGANPPGFVVTSVPINMPWDELALATLLHPETFDPEFVDAYEVGTKNTLLDGKLTFNLNAFYYDYTGYQISQIVDRSAVNMNFDAEIWGAELVADWRPLENLRLGFKGGYENTRLADGTKAIDLMDRTAGDPNYVLMKPFPTLPANCIVPLDMVFGGGVGCQAYKVGQAYWDAPNNGEGIYKDLSGNELPNAPHFTATITGDYTLPLPNEWLMTLHTDLYYQSEAWTRIFNTEGYDKLKAYTNVNVAAIFTNEDAGWTVMAYVKNLMDRDSITGAFLNSDDTGLTTNVFLTEPRLYGVRVTKAWSGSEWWSARANRSGHYPFRLELNGDYGPFSGDHEILVPDTVALFPEDHPYPLWVQNDLEWLTAGGVKFTYQPQAEGWSLSAAVRYGRAATNAEAHPKWEVPGGYTTIASRLPPGLEWFRFYRDPDEDFNAYNYATTSARNEESHAMADFTVGKDVGLGRLNSHLGVGLRYAHFNSNSNIGMHGRPDLYFPPEGIVKYGVHMHRFHAIADSRREFEGGGPTLSWDGSLPLRGAADATGRVDLDVGVGGTVLWGRQTTNVEGDLRNDYVLRFSIPTPLFGGVPHIAQYEVAPFSSHRSKTVTVPGVNLNLGLSYTLGGLKLSGGYRLERYFDAIDGGLTERKTYDRQFDGPYFKVSIGFGG